MHVWLFPQQTCGSLCRYLELFFVKLLVVCLANSSSQTSWILIPFPSTQWDHHCLGIIFALRSGKPVLMCGKVPPGRKLRQIPGLPNLYSFFGITIQHCSWPNVPCSYLNIYSKYIFLIVYSRNIGLFPVFPS